MGGSFLLATYFPSYLERAYITYKTRTPICFTINWKENKNIQSYPHVTHVSPERKRPASSLQGAGAPENTASSEASSWCLQPHLLQAGASTHGSPALRVNSATAAQGCRVLLSPCGSFWALRTDLFLFSYPHISPSGILHRVAICLHTDTMSSSLGPAQVWTVRSSCSPLGCDFLGQRTAPAWPTACSKSLAALCCSQRAPSTWEFHRCHQGEVTTSPAHLGPKTHLSSSLHWLWPASQACSEFLYLSRSSPPKFGFI